MKVLPKIVLKLNKDTNTWSLNEVNSKDFTLEELGCFTENQKANINSFVAQTQKKEVSITANVMFFDVNNDDEEEFMKWCESK